MKKKYFVVWILTLSMLFAVAGCGGAGTENFSADAAATEAAIPQEAASFAGESYDTAEGVAEDAGGAITSENGIEPVAENGRKLIKTVNLEMQTKEFDTVVEGINKKYKRWGLYRKFLCLGQQLLQYRQHEKFRVYGAYSVGPAG